MSKLESALVVPPGAFFASTSNVSVEMFFDSNWGRSLLGFGIFFYQKLSGNGTVFLQKDRWLILNEIKVERSNTIIIDPQEVYGYTLNSLVKQSGFSFKNFLSGEGFSSFQFQGPAIIYTYNRRSAYGVDGIKKGVYGRLGCLFFIIFILFNFIRMCI